VRKINEFLVRCRKKVSLWGGKRDHKTTEGRKTVNMLDAKRKEGVASDWRERV